jgi:hypothetical protein
MNIAIVIIIFMIAAFIMLPKDTWANSHDGVGGLRRGGAVDNSQRSSGSW